MLEFVDDKALVGDQVNHLASANCESLIMEFQVLDRSDGFNTVDG
jgi:hypothetical protein